MTAALVRYRLAIGLATAVTAAAAFAAATLWPKTYEATATVVLLESDVLAGGTVDTAPTIAGHAARLQSRSVLAAAAEDLQRFDSDALDDRVSVMPDERAGLISVTATGSSPAEATTIANTLTGTYEQTSRDRVIKRLDDADAVVELRSEELAEQIANLRRRLADRPGDVQPQLNVLLAQQRDLQIRLGELSADLALYGSGIQSIEQAVEPTGPVFPVPAREAAVAGVLGLLLASVVAYRRARHVEACAIDPAAVLGAPLLARFPQFAFSAASTSEAVFDPDAAEAYQFLLASLEYAASRTDVRSILVTSAGSGEGKSLTALHLARALAMQGRDVALVDTDLRARGLASVLRSDDEGGLVALSKGADLDDVVRRYRVSDSVQLHVIPSGRRPAQPTGLFTTAPYRDAIARITRRYELTIIDGSPLLTFADASAVATQVGGIVLVLDVDTPKDEIYQVRDRLRLMSTPLLGYIVNRASGGPQVAHANGAGGAYEPAQDSSTRRLQGSRERGDGDHRTPHGAAGNGQRTGGARAAVSGSE